MELIDKNKLLEKLKKLKQNLSASPIVVIDDVESLVESLKVKEVDLEEEIDKELDRIWYGEYLNTDKFSESAKHFFELGLKAQKGE